MDMAFTPDEERRVAHMERVIEHMAEQMGEVAAQNKSMYNVMVGEPHFQRKGIAERVADLEKTSERIEHKVDEIEAMYDKIKKSWKPIVITLVIGILIGALAFGLITWSQFVETTKEGIKMVK